MASTVIIPFYNSHATLERAITSVIRQTVSCQLVLVNDGSSDDSLALAQQWQRHYPARIKLHHCANNSGPSVARNLGVLLSQTAYIAFLDADDAYHPQFIEATQSVMDAHPDVAACKTGIDFIGVPEGLWDADNDPRYEGIVGFSLVNGLFRKAAILACGGLPIDDAFRTDLGGEDCAFSSAMFRLFDRVMISNKLVQVFNRPDSHLEQYLKRTVVAQGRIDFLDHLPIEQNNAIGDALNRAVDHAKHLSQTLQQLKHY